MICKKCSGTNGHKLGCPYNRMPSKCINGCTVLPDMPESMKPHLPARFVNGWLQLDLRDGHLERTKQELRELLGPAFLPSEGA